MLPWFGDFMMGQSYDLEIQWRHLKREVYQLRQDAIRNGSFEAWRLARELRDAATIDQIVIVAHRLERLRNAESNTVQQQRSH